MLGFHSFLSLLTFSGCLCVGVVSQCSSGATGPGVVFAQQDGEVTLNCSSSVTPIAWYKNNIPLPTSSGSRTTFLSNGDLRFSNLRLSQSGWYTCVSSTPTGRVEEDFMLVVGHPPVHVVYPAMPYAINVLPNSRVELSCLTIDSSPGIPTPEVVWKDGFDRPIVEDNINIMIDRTTGSLVFRNYTMDDQINGGYFCELCNQFGNRTATRTDVSITDTGGLPHVYSSPLNAEQSVLRLAPNQDSNHTIRCTGLEQSQLDSFGYTIQWDRNFASLSMSVDDSFVFRASPTLNLADSGYYCCNVANNSTQMISRHCVTVLIGEDPRFAPRPFTSITLPSGQERRVQLFCSTNQEVLYDTPLVTVSTNQTAGVTAYANESPGLNYLTVAGVDTVGSDDTTSYVYTCAAGNFVNRKTLTFTVTAVDVCDGENLVQGGNAETDLNISPLSYWTGNGSANVTTVDNEQVFILTYSGPGITLRQTFSGNNTPAIHISGRIRQTSANGSHRGVATIRLTADGEVFNLSNPNSVSEAWQWVGQSVSFNQTVSSMRVELLVLPSPGQSASTLSGVAYFDDVCVSAAPGVVSTPLPLEIIIGAAVGGGVFLLLLLLIMCICCCCCCSVSRRKDHTRRMKRMSLNITQKLSTRNKRYQSEIPKELDPFGDQTSAVVLTQTASSANDSQALYDNVVRIEADYIEPENYQYINEQVRVGHTQPIGINPEDGKIYTAIDPTSLEEHVYTTTTPITHRSRSSLDNIQDEEYTEVNPAVSAPYLTLIGHPLKSSLQAGNGEIRDPRRTSSQLSPSSLREEQMYANQEELYENDVRIRSQTSPGHLDPVSGEIYAYVNDDM